MSRHRQGRVLPQEEAAAAVVVDRRLAEDDDDDDDLEDGIELQDTTKRPLLGRDY